MSTNDLDKERRVQTLEKLEGVEWDAPAFQSHLVTTCHGLRKKPIGEFTVEDLRIMIGQNLGLLFLVPIALDVLEQDALTEGDFYPGDLLASMLRSDPTFWHRHLDSKSRLGQIVAKMSEVPAEIAKELEDWRRRSV